MAGRAEKSTPPPDTTALVLAASVLPADHLLLREVLSQRSWKLHDASTRQDAWALLRHHSVPVLLAERDHAEEPASGAVAPTYGSLSLFH
jgi:hypothetical protein